MASKSGWTFDDVPDQTGKTAIVTGSNSGIGLETARFLVMRGATCVDTRVTCGELIMIRHGWVHRQCLHGQV